MSPNLLTTLAWLPPPPRDFNERVRRLREHQGDASAGIQELAAYRLDENQTRRLARAIADLRSGPHGLARLVPFRLGLLGNGTLDLVEPALTVAAARYGIALELVRGGYDQIVQEALDPNSAINQAQPDAVLLAIDDRGLKLTASPGDSAAAEESVDSALSLLGSVRSALRQNTNAICILQTIAPPAETLFGSFDRILPGTTRSIIEAINRKLCDSLADTPDLLLDVASLAATVGLAEWHSPREWNLGKFPFANSCVLLYAEHVARLLAALRGKTRKCLVLDLDNTIWGGVIGDDGLGGIVLAQGDATGEAFLSVQRLALTLRQRGIVLAVSSKNNDEVARAAFQQHPEMLLKEHHIAAFQANWNDKATNIKAIADELSLGLDAMVFLDDNPVERELVRRLLPQVAVPELPDDPAYYARTLSVAGYFESVAFSDEDRKRAAMYQENARRLTLRQQVGDVAAYLASLDMQIEFRPFESTGRARIVQLINKSNQFNLTTRRYTDAEIAALEHGPDKFTLQVRLVDTFGDNGMISVVICRPASDSASDAWEIDTWLMSCRVLGRRVEDMVLREILYHARQNGVARLIGVYRPTERNALVRDHYSRLGFTRISEDTDGATVWELSTEAEVEPAPMRVVRVVPDLMVSA